MQSLIYKDIIDEKVTEWQNNLKKLEEQATKGTSDTKAKLNEKVKKFKSEIETAVIQLRSLDEQETVANTMETKNKIVKIFSAIDKDFIDLEDKTPFML